MTEPYTLSERLSVLVATPGCNRLQETPDTLKVYCEDAVSFARARQRAEQGAMILGCHWMIREEDLFIFTIKLIPKGNVPIT